MIFLYFIPPLLALARFILFLVKGRDVYPAWLRGLVDLGLMVAAPAFLLFLSYTDEQNCCKTDGLNPLASDHVMTVAAWWLIGVVAYGFVQYRKRISTPLIEVMTAWILLFSLLLNGFLVYQALDFAYLFCLPIIMQLLMALTRQHRQLTPRLRQLTRPSRSDMLDDGALSSALPEVPEENPLPDTGWQAIFSQLLEAPLLAKYPILLIAGVPVFILVDSVLLLFGQKPDSLVLAFTQTFHYKLSELDYLCEGVQCGGHYLCSVAAGGHQSVVKPVRLGIRGGKTIVCNRQLLVANAFEEVLQERFPAAHRIIRKHYDRVGDFIHKDYTPYENKYLCDLIYLLMKPADWAFRIFLYTVDRDPESRIARQYTVKP